MSIISYFLEVSDINESHLYKHPIEDEDESYGIIVKVREGRKTGYIPLADVEVVSQEDSNFWLVREYVVWFANR